MGPLPTRGGDEANHAKSQRSGRRASLIACGPQVQGLPRISHKGDVQYRMRQCGGPRHAHPVQDIDNTIAISYCRFL